MISYFIVAFTCGWCLYWLLNNAAGPADTPELGCACGSTRCACQPELGCAVPVHQPNGIGQVFIRRAALLKKACSQKVQLIVAESARGPPTLHELQVHNAALPPPPPPLAETEDFEVTDSDIELPLPPPPSAPEPHTRPCIDMLSRRSSTSSSSLSGQSCDQLQQHRGSRFQAIDGWLRASQPGLDMLSLPTGLRSPRPPPTPDSLTSLASSSNHSSAYFSNSSSNSHSNQQHQNYAQHNSHTKSHHSFQTKNLNNQSQSTSNTSPAIDNNGNQMSALPAGCVKFRGREAAPLAGYHIAVSEPIGSLCDLSCTPAKPLSTQPIPTSPDVVQVTSSDFSWAQDEVSILRQELTVAGREFDENEKFGHALLTKLKQAQLSPSELDKVNVHIDEVDKVTRLLMSLGQRLRTIERDLAAKSSQVLKHQQQQQMSDNLHNCTPMSNLVKTTKIILETAPLITLPDNLDNQPEIQLLIAKRSKLITQLGEAEQLRALIEKRTLTLRSKIESNSNVNCSSDFCNFVDRKSRLISEMALINERIMLCEICE